MPLSEGGGLYPEDELPTRGDHGAGPPKKGEGFQGNVLGLGRRV